MNRARIFFAVALLAAACANAQTVYKCVHDGQTSYGDIPCPAGQLQMLAAPAPPPAVDKGAATRQERVASQLEFVRKQQEQREDAARARGSNQLAAREKHCAQLRLERKWAAEDAAGASDKTRDAAQLRAHRAAEKLAVACPN